MPDITEQSGAASDPPIEWRNVVEDAGDTMVLVLQGLIVWGACIGALIGAMFWAAHGDKCAWIMLGAVVLVFAPIAAGLAIWRAKYGRFIILARTVAAAELHEALQVIARDRLPPVLQRQWVPVITGAALVLVVISLLFVLGVLP